MTVTLFKKFKNCREDAGIALLTTMLLLFLMSSLLVGLTVLLYSNQSLAGANDQQVRAFYGAEAGMEQLTAGLGNLFDETYSPSIAQINTLETTQPNIPGISFLKGDGTSGYLITPQAFDANGNPAPTITTISAGPYQGMTAMATTYTLMVNARTEMGQEVTLKRTAQTVGIPMFQFAVFCEVDCAFHAGQDFTMGGRVHGNGNLFLAAGGGTTLTMQGKVDAYKDIIRSTMDNGASVSANWPGTVSVTTGGGNYRSLALTEGSESGGTCDTSWKTISTGASPTDYASNLIDGLGSVCPQYSTGADMLNLGIVTLGAGATHPIDLIRRPVNNSESAQITGERYFAQSSRVILLSDNPTDIMNLPCVDQTTQPFDLSQLAQPVINWPTGAGTPTGQLLTAMTNYGTTPLPLAASGAASGAATYNPNNPTTGTSGIANTDGYWLPQSYPIIKGYLKIQAQTAYGSPCGTWKDVTVEVLALGYAGKNINPVSQSLNGAALNPAWPGSTTQMDRLSYNATNYYSTTLSTNASAPNQLQPNAGYSAPLPNPASAQLGPQQNQTVAAMAAGNYTGQAGTCLDPHPNAVIRLERIRDNPSSLYAAHYKPAASWINYVASGTLSAANLPRETTVAVVCGVDPATGKLPIIADQNGNTAMWTPQPWDFWNNTLFDTREGTPRDNTPTAAANQNEPTINGTMHYVELDVKNLTKWFAGTIGTSGASTKDPVNSPNDFSVYFSDRRGNYAATQTWTGTWPPTSPSTHETGEYGWTDFINSNTDPNNGCPNNGLDGGEDLDALGQQFTYGANTADINYIMGYTGAGATLALNFLYTNPAATGNQIAPVLSGTNTLSNPVPYGQFGFYTVANLTAANGALTANPNCAAPAYSNNIWPFMYASASNAARENPPIFFRRSLKLVNGNNLGALGTCPSGAACGLAVAAENPVYIQGDYNANSAGNGFNDPSVGASVAGDAVTILSNAWNDTNSFSYGEYCMTSVSGCTVTPRNPAATFYRTAVIAGKGVSFPEFAGNADNGTDGGLHNFLRYLEAWGNGGLTVNYLGALVNLYTNRQATGMFKCCQTVYSVPNRAYAFDTNFLLPSGLPPRTPLFRDVDTTGWTRLLLPGQYH